MDYEAPLPYLTEPLDPMNDEGYVALPSQPGLGYSFNWDYIEEHTIS